LQAYLLFVILSKLNLTKLTWVSKIWQ